jgi:hypothetical protein
LIAEGTRRFFGPGAFYLRKGEKIARKQKQMSAAKAAEAYCWK